jgi:hypothetical protein
MFAKRKGVRTWLTDERYEFALLEYFRAAEPV